MHQGVEHVRVAAGMKQSVAILGPANVGKSTLYNQLIWSKDDEAEVSAVPGTTRESQKSDAGLFLLVDTPGADAVGGLGEVERERAMRAAVEGDVLVLMFDAVHGIRGPEKELLEALQGFGKPLVVVVNKMDLVKKEADRVLRKIAESTGLDRAQLVPISALKGDGLERLLREVVRAEPEIVAALGAALPAYRWSLAQTVVVRSASTAGAVALTPLPLLDFIPLMGIQIAMVLSIARIYAYKITLRRARELIVSFGLGVLGRTLFYELSKLGGPPGWLVAAGVAAGTTVAMGYGAAIWFERGERLSRDALGHISKAVTRSLIGRLKGIGGRRPKKNAFKERLQQALEDIPLQERVDEDAV
jgi:small GTP-binding protein